MHIADSQTMSRIARLARVTLAGLSLLAGPAVAGELFEEGAFADYKGDVPNGKYLFSVAGCGTCHGAENKADLLSGGRKFETAIGRFYAPNISPAPAGIGGWTNAQFLNSVMNGISVQGGDVFPIMPFNGYHGMRPEDVLDIKAYIETLAPSDAVSIDHEIPLSEEIPGVRTYSASYWTAANLSPAFQQNQSSPAERGRYLAENVAGCANCHTPRDSSLNIEKTRDLTGWTGLTNATAPDISKARVAGLPDADAFFIGFIKEGNKFNGSPIGDPLMRGVVDGLRSLRASDQEALYTYLSGKQVVKVDVAKSPTAVCKKRKTAPTAAVDDGAAKFASIADSFMSKYCRNCHGPGQSFASIYETGDLASIAANKAFVIPGNAAGSPMFKSITSGDMPKGVTRPDNFADEVKGLESWLNTLSTEKAAPAQVPDDEGTRGRPLIPYTEFQDAALKDIQSVPDRDRETTRYFSFREEYNTLFECEDHETFMKRMPVFAGGFKKLLNSLSREPNLVVPTEVEGTDGLLLRVNIRDLGWSKDQYQFLADSYPYAMDPASADKLKPIADATGTGIPIMRAGWFVSFAARPEFYNKLLDMPPKIKDLEDRFGIDVADNIHSLKIKRAAFEKGASGVSDHNRMIERHDINAGYYWKSYDFAGDKGKQVLDNFPDGPGGIGPLKSGLQPFEHDGGEMIFSLPNGMQGYYLSTAKGDRLDAGPTTIVSHRTRPHGATFGVIITNARSCFDCHENGIVTKGDQMRAFIETSNAFDTRQKDRLLAMYVKQTELDDLYQKDRERFVNALSKLGVTEKNESGVEQSLKAPGNAEIVTYDADKYDEGLDLAGVAGEFDMSPADFSAKVSMISNPKTQHLASGWLNKLKVGKTVERQEIEESYPVLISELLGVDALSPVAKESIAKQTLPEKKTDPKPAATDPDEFQLEVKVGKVNVKVNDILKFDVSATKACDLQVVYVEDGGAVKVLPEGFVGKARLDAGETRTIPQPGKRIRFDRPGKNETLVVLCRTDDQSDFKLDEATAQEYVKRYRDNIKRGIALELDKQVRSDPMANAFKFVVFNIKE